MKARLKSIKQQTLTAPAWIFGIILAYFAAIFPTKWLFRLMLNFGILTPLNETILTLSQGTIAYGVVTVLLLAGAWWLRGKPLSLRDMGLWRLPDWRDIGLSLVGALAYAALAVLLLSAAQLIPGFDVNQAQDTGLNGRLYSFDLLAAFAVLVVAAPFFEELVFRGILYGRLRDSQLPQWLATIIVSAFFGLAHMQWNVGVDVFALSVVTCVLREKTDSIWSGFLLHSIKNGIAFYSMYVMIGIG